MFNYNKDVCLILKNAEVECINDGSNYLSSIYLLLSILKNDNQISRVLNGYDVYYDSIKRIRKKKNDNYVFYTNSVKKILELSIMNARDFKQEKVSLEILFLSFLDIGESKAYDYLCSILDIDKLYIEVKNLLFNNDSFENIGSFLTDYENVKTFDRVFNRDNEIDRIVNILLHKKKSNPILIGEAGVGKSAIIEELSRRIYENNVPNGLINKRILSIRVSSLIAGTKYRGEFEEKLDKLINYVIKHNDIILFIDEIHTVIGAGGSEGAIDASNILKPFLSRSDIKLIGATTLEEYNKYIAKDKAFQRRFEKVLIEEPDFEDTVNILNNIKNEYELFHNVIVPKDIINKIVLYSKKYITTSHEPDKSIDLLDEVCTYKSILKNKKGKNNLNNKLKEVINLKNQYLRNKDYKNAFIYKQKEDRIVLNNKIKKKITQNDLDEVIGIIFKCRIIRPKDKNLLINYLYKKNLPINISRNIVLSYFEYNNSILNKPYVLLTNIKEIGKWLSDYLNINYIDINVENHSYSELISKFIGSPSGYVGYGDNNTIFESIKLYKNTIIEINNIDKCNIKIINMVKKIVDNGYLINNKNEKIDFSNTFIILTLNNSKKVGFNSNNSINLDIKCNKIITYEYS